MKASITILLALPLLAQQAVDTYSPEKERVLGRGLASDVTRQSKPLGDAVADAYVKRIGGQLVSHLAETPFEYNFEVILARDGIEPQSILGGYIFIPSAFFLAAQDEAEFAGMLAHAIGHIALRHGTRRIVQAQIQDRASILLVFIGGWTGSHTDTRRGILTPVGFWPFQREMNSRRMPSGSTSLRNPDSTQPACAATSRALSPRTPGCRRCLRASCGWRTWTIFSMRLQPLRRR